MCLHKGETITFTKKEVDDFLRAKGYYKSSVRVVSAEIRMLNHMGIRTKEAVWDRYYNHSANYRSALCLAITLMDELCSYLEEEGGK